MATSKEYLRFVLDQLSDLPEISSRPMMGEYVLYYRGRVIGGIYDDRFLLKDTPAAREVFPEEQGPYEGASPMLLVDSEDPARIAEVVAAMVSVLPKPKKKR